MNKSMANESTFLANFSTGQVSEIGGVLFFLMYLSDYLPYTIISILGFVLGFFGNLMIIGAVLSTKELQSMTNILVFNLALADFVISTFVDSWRVAGKHFLDKKL